ncbi:hypothetical protein BJ165DRAFT_190584 [Panaeolus papilionaceus]|nr:hypothetical protein BJ165DRAFT_190584 [Panaeolus papilionaceus]
MLTVTLLFEVICLVITLILVESLAVVYISFLCGLSLFLIYIISLLLRYSQKPDSAHWLATGQAQSIISSLVAMIMFAYAAYQRSPFVAIRALCYSRRGYPSICVLVNVLYVFACATPFAMTIASWMIWLKALGRFGMMDRYNVCELDEGSIELP